MKIAILCPTFYIYQGISRVAEHQAKEFLEKGNEVAIFCFKSNMEPPLGVKLNILGMPENYLGRRIYRLLFPLDFPKLIKWVPKLRSYDIIYSHAEPLHWLAYLAKKKYGTKYVYYNHHFNPPSAYPTFVERFYIKLRFIQTKWLVRRADSAISISEYSRNMLKEQVGKDSIVIYNSIDVQRFHSGIDGSRIRQKHNLGNVPVVLFIGEVSPTKGIHLLIQSFNEVTRIVPKAKLLIVGAHPYKKYLETLNKISNDSVIFTGPVPDEEVPYYYAACDVYATASIWEGFDMPVAEAQNCGKPVVAFDVGPHREVIKSGKLGKLVPTKDTKAMATAILNFIDENELQGTLLKPMDKI